MGRQLRIVLVALVVFLTSLVAATEPATAATTGPLVYGVSPFTNATPYGVDSPFRSGTGHFSQFGLQPFNGADGSNIGGSVVTITGGAEAGKTVGSVVGLAIDPTSSIAYAVLSKVSTFPQNPPTRFLATINLTNGEATSIGQLESSGVDIQVAGITFSSTGTLYAVSGDGSDVCPACLYTVNKATAELAHQRDLGTTGDCCGEAIAFNPDDGMIYHVSGIGSGTVFEKLDPGNSFAATNVGLSSGAFDEITGIGWDPDADLFIAVDLDRVLVNITAGGVITEVGRTDSWLRGIAVVPDPVDAVAADDFEIVARNANLTDLDVRANDIDATGDPVGLIDDITQPSNGTAEIRNAGTTIGYTPDEDYCNTQSGNPDDVQPDTFTYTLDNGPTASVVVSVECPVVDAGLTLKYNSRMRKFKGVLTAANSACLGGVQVEIMRVDPTDGDLTVASTQTDSEGKFSVRKRARGRYYAATFSQQIPNTANCNGASSDVIKVK